MPVTKQIKSPQQIWEAISSTFVHFVESIFFTLGVVIARRPWTTIIITWLFLFVSCIGLMRFYIEKNPMQLWVPPDSDFYRDTHWYIDNFGTGFRLQKIIITADNVLEPKVLSKIRNITQKVNSLKVEYIENSYSLEDLCFQVPVVNFLNLNENSRSVKSVSDKNGSSRNVNSDSDFSDPTLWIGDEFYCGFLDTFQMDCLQYNILDLWSNNADSIMNLTKHDIVSKVNSVKKNPVTGHPFDYTKMLGGVKRDENGDIVSANSIMLIWYTHVNMSAIDINEVGNLVGTEDWVSVPLGLWEAKFLDLMNSLSHNTSDIHLYYEAGRSFADISGEAMFHELDKLFLGIILMFIYIQFALSRCNWLEIRLTLGSVGLLCVGMAYVTAVSWCSVIGIPFGPVHSSLPFLLMGLGVDDMFVMNACWRNLSPAETKKSLPVKIGLMLQHAGVSIVITSFTDIVALLIGAITILPSLKSFCIYAAMGVFFIFCYSVTFYVAIFTLDIQRMEANRNGILFCYKHSKDIHVAEDKTIFQKILASFYKRVVFTMPGRTIIILATLVMTGFSIESIMHLEQKFDPKWFIPEDTYFKEFLNIHEYYYPEEGHPAMVFLGKMDYQHEFPNLYSIAERLKNQTYVDDVTNWVESFHGYVLKNYERDLKNTTTVTNDEFNAYLTRFLFSPIGGRFQLNFKFSTPIKCGSPAPNITASSMSFKFGRFHGPEEYIPAMNHAKDVVKSTPITTGDEYRSAWSKAFANWVTDEVIGEEVERNIELALLCVMICTVILITNLQMCFWIFICVLLTIVNVLGWMQKWGMTVDIVCCIGLELAIGLCVDYAAHIGHTFLTTSGDSRTDRAFKTVTSIGTAVLLGGGSTFLSLSILSMSQSYTFKSFFKIFFLVIVFGLFNGLMFLPVVLSLIGPDAYRKKEETEKQPEAMELNGKHQIAIPTEKQIFED
ncbi:patched domain-containing protein 3-like [Ostrinia furnacalis]|uniref:patched domain-containing protein 3-like n=1 Tax=Ostrinia furnacalis TaxID=93504 RepID=UPI00103D1D19|nr:patched domain-containing protein 3-like [Ostrinia furnacalis]